MSGDTLKLSRPSGKNPRGNSALPASAEDKIAQGRALAENKQRIKELEKNNADLEKLLAAQDKQTADKQKQAGKQAPAANPAQGQTRHMAHAQGWKAACTEPDLCKVGKTVVAFDSFATLDDKQKASPNVKARGTPVYRQGDLFKTVQADAGKHIESGTSLGSGHVKILDGHNNVKVNNIPVARHDSRCKINCDAAGMGGAMGKLITEQKNVGARGAGAATHPGVPPGERTSEKLEKLKAARAQVAAGQLDLDALDEYVNFKDANAGLDGLIGQISGTPGTVGDYAAQATRGVLGFGKDLVMGVGELAYEGIKGVPKLIRLTNTESGKLLAQLDAQILVENIKLGNVTTGTVGQGALNLGKAIVKPVTDPWSKGQYVEAGTRAVAEIGTLAVGWIKGSKALKAAEAKKAADAAEAAKAAAAADAAMAADAGKAGGSVAGHVDDGVHVAAAASRSAALRELLERKWGKASVDEAIKAKRADPKLDALLTDDEYLSIRAYTSNLYREINPALRSGAVGEWDTLVQEASKGMDKMASNGYDFTGMVRRDLTLSSADIDRLFKSSGQFSDPAFMSTSKELTGVFPGNTTVLIDGKSGVLVNTLSEFPNEAEVLFKPGTQFSVTKVIDGSPGTSTKIFLEEILK